jgi:hypothetical protein
LLACVLLGMIIGTVTEITARSTRLWRDRRRPTVLVASLLVLSTMGAACHRESNKPTPSADRLGQRERQLLDKLEVVQQRERNIQTKLAEVRRRKQSYLSRVATRQPHAPVPTPPSK